MRYIVGSFAFTGPFSDTTTRAIRFLSDVSLVTFSDQEFTECSRGLAQIVLLGCFRGWSKREFAASRVSLEKVSHL